jgi:hypothetical protein
MGLCVSLMGLCALVGLRGSEGSGVVFSASGFGGLSTFGDSLSTGTLFADGVGLIS